MASKNFEEFKKEYNEKKVEITATEFTDISASVLAEGRISDLIKNNPMLVIAFGIYHSDLVKEIFFKDAQESEDEE